MAKNTPATFTIPAPVAEYCAQAAEVLRSSERMLRGEYEAAKDDADPDWRLFVPHAEAAICADNLAMAARFLAWLGGAAPTDGGADG